MTALLALILGFAALGTQPQPLPDLFVQGAREWSVPIMQDGFIGLAWICEPERVGIGFKGSPHPEQVVFLREAALAETTEDDVCYAGWSDGALVTGP